jgi:hypothetical protein
LSEIVQSDAAIVPSISIVWADKNRFVICGNGIRILAKFTEIKPLIEILISQISRGYRGKYQQKKKKNSDDYSGPVHNLHKVLFSVHLITILIHIHDQHCNNYGY